MRSFSNNNIQDFQDFFTLVGDFAKVGFAHFDAVTCEGYALSHWYRNVGEKEGRPLTEIINVYEHLHPEDRIILQHFLKEAVEVHFSSMQGLALSPEYFEKLDPLFLVCIAKEYLHFCPKQVRGTNLHGRG